MTTAQMTDAEIVLGGLSSLGVGNGCRGRLKDEVLSLENDCQMIRTIANELKGMVTIKYDPNDKDYGDPEPSFDFYDVRSDNYNE